MKKTTTQTACCLLVAALVSLTAGATPQEAHASHWSPRKLVCDSSLFPVGYCVAVESLSYGGKHVSVTLLFTGGGAGTHGIDVSLGGGTQIADVIGQVMCYDPDDWANQTWHTTGETEINTDPGPENARKLCPAGLEAAYGYGYLKG